MGFVEEVISPADALPCPALCGVHISLCKAAPGTAHFIVVWGQEGAEREEFSPAVTCPAVLFFGIRFQ